MKSFAIFIFLIGAAVFLMSLFFKKSDQPEVGSPRQSSPAAEVREAPTPVTASTSGEPRAADLNKTKKYSAVLRTSQGEIVIDLNAHQTPKTVSNFIELSKSGFYNKTVFHRVVKGFMIQGGDPKGDGTGGPGYYFADEPFTGDYLRGTVAMANTGQPSTNGSQFFIMHQDYPLPKTYVIFGQVTKGMEIVDKIAEAPVTANAFGESSKPVTPVVVSSVEIQEN